MYKNRDGKSASKLINIRCVVAKPRPHWVDIDGLPVGTCSKGQVVVLCCYFVLLFCCVIVIVFVFVVIVVVALLLLILLLCCVVVAAVVGFYCYYSF